MSEGARRPGDPSAGSRGDRELPVDVAGGPYACPECLSQDLGVGGGALRCGGCGEHYPIQDGIPAFSPGEPRFFWGVPPERLEWMLAEVGHLGWRQAMMRLCSALAPKEAELLWLRTLGRRRVALQMLLPVGKDAVVLDAGSGFGAVSLGIATYCRQVVALDQMRLHLRWLRAACEAHGLGNVTLVQAGRSRHLPFPADTFDVVVLNGVLEWVASNTEGAPRAVQARFLREVARILKPTGQVYIGIENRINYRYFLGVPEGHIGMRFGALLPRFLTRAYLRLARNRPFREYTYTLLGYRKLLREAGFACRRFYAAWPAYSALGSVFPIGDTGRMKLRVAEIRHPAGRRPWGYFGRAFVMTASKEPPSASLLERVLQEICERRGEGPPITLKGCLFRVTAAGKATLTVASRNGPDWHVEVGLTPDAGELIARQHRALVWLHARALPADVKRRIPVSLMRGEVAGHEYGARQFVPGRSAGELVRDPAARELLCREAADFLCGLQLGAGRRVRVDDASFRRLFGHPIAGVRQWFTQTEWEEQEPWFEQMASRWKSRLTGLELALVPSHGDFVPDNCVSPKAEAEVSQILDWELFDDAGLPMVDLVTFLGRAYRRDVAAKLAGHEGDRGQMKFHGYPEMFLEDPLRAVLVRYLGRLEIQSVALEPLLFMWWVKQLQDWAPFHLYNPAWRRLRVFPVIQRWQTALGGRPSVT